ncbi:helix-turn-helix domain-containing protein [Mesorhizobium sp. BR1-1-7]|uniref:helix-turn-helix domain-containing protein n=1 Tax=Mesorhizobium sp. BR1-1-7 TaxID=2876647 RepID=UPI001CCE9DF8|nr:helix-turn-helix transcriptional regulator [Mesorhizobium sp. BR1-1-7]MBZ9921474.1 helix-turn-helix domain-containing protein [Mesorhizobium sp. BR1-1-7]
MTNHEFRAIRQRLGITQAQLARVLGYELPLTVSTMERETNPKPIPELLARLMRAYDEGYRPPDWPRKDDQ